MYTNALCISGQTVPLKVHTSTHVAGMVVMYPEHLGLSAHTLHLHVHRHTHMLGILMSSWCLVSLKHLQESSTITPYHCLLYISRIKGIKGSSNSSVAMCDMKYVQAKPENTARVYHWPQICQTGPRTPVRLQWAHHSQGHVNMVIRWHQESWYPISHPIYFKPC